MPNPAGQTEGSTTGQSKALIPGPDPASSPRHSPAILPRSDLRQPPEWTPRTARIPAGEHWTARVAEWSSLSPNGNLAQLVEQRTLNPSVESSNLSVPTTRIRGKVWEHTSHGEHK